MQPSSLRNMEDEHPERPYSGSPPTSDTRSQPWRNMLQAEQKDSARPWNNWKPSEDKPFEKPWIQWGVEFGIDNCRSMGGS